jgi:hypothetical protein
MSNEHYLSPEQKIENIEAIVQEHPVVAGLAAYEYLRNDSIKQKPAFISGEQTDLEFTYPDLTEEAIDEVKQPMLGALVALMPGEKNDKTIHLYDAIEYRYSELFMLDMARIMNSSEAGSEDRSEARDWFVMANEGLYGKPDREVFSALAANNLFNLVEARDGDSEEISSLRLELQELVGSVSSTDFEPFAPDVELVTWIGELVHERFDELVEHIDLERTYEVEDMREALDIALDKIGGKDVGWKTVVVPNSSVLAVSAHQKQVEVGENRKSIKGDELRGKVLHEVGVHAGRSINAEKAGWLSAAYGQNGYLDFEEAFATSLEDAYKGEFDNHGVNYYMVAGLAYGLDDHVPRDLRETFDVMWRMKALDRVKDGQITQEDITKAKSNAFISVMRLFRGTTGKDRGVVYLKDMAYFNGQELAWGVLKNVQSQHDFDYLFAGKLDNSKADHQRIARLIIDNRAQ